MISSSTAKRKLQGNIEDIIVDAKKLINAASGDATDKTKQAFHRLQDSLEAAKKSFEDVECTAETAVRTGKKYISDYPLEAMGITLGVGILLGMLIRWK